MGQNCRSLALDRAASALGHVAKLHTGGQSVRVGRESPRTEGSIMSKTWLITGASAGLGRLMTERLLIRGDRVVATVRREDAIADLQAQHGDRLAVSTLNLIDTAAIGEVVDDAFNRMGRIDVA